MVRTKIAGAAMAALALAAGPLAATPAAAEENHPCAYLFTDPLAGICYLPIEVYCMVFPQQAICH